ncbi:hypothetical protein ACTJKH_00135 [Microbacterium sp. 22215]|uniref:hypothetical protein n=1 Tax=Microbacterium sp. 22215 TaxID=3453893 RepID=UPI003F860319
MTTPDQPVDELSDFAALMAHEQEFGGDRFDPAVRRRRRRRGLIITAVCLVLLLAVTGGYVGWALTAPVDPPAVTTHTPEVPVGAAAAIAAPAAAASAISIAGADAYLGEGASGSWSTTGTGEPLPIASITKLITALVILDASPLSSAEDPGPTITFGKADHDLYDEYYVRGATIAPMPTGTSMSLHDALAVMLIPSASNYAVALSSRIFGSQSASSGRRASGSQPTGSPGRRSRSRRESVRATRARPPTCWRSRSSPPRIRRSLRSSRRRRPRSPEPAGCTTPTPSSARPGSRG